MTDVAAAGLDNVEAVDIPYAARRGERPRFAPRWTARQLAWGMSFFLIALATFWAGVKVRQWVWRETQEIRFFGDINNAFRWGLAVNSAERTSLERPPTWAEFWKGYQGLYDREYNNESGAGWTLDYGPFRLLIMSLWVKWLLAKSPNPGQLDGWIGHDASPLLWFNCFCALMAAIAAFLLVRLWSYRWQKRQGVEPPNAWGPWVRGYAAAALIWLNPGILIDAHAWPQWDVWPIPFFLWAVYFASRGGWFTAGALVMTGTLFKGQMMLAAPVLLVWALFAGGVRPILGLLLGFATASAVITSAWLLPSKTAWLATGGAVATAIAIAGVVKYCWRGVRKVWLGYGVAAVLAGAVWGGCWYFGGSTAWLHITFLNPIDRRDKMSFTAFNMPDVMANQYGWDVDDVMLDVKWPKLGAPDGVTVKVGMRALYALTLVLAGFAAAVQARRGNPRVLIAVAVPWVLFYALLPQMFQRYLVWGGSISAIGVAVSADMAIVHALLGFIAAIGIVRRLCDYNSDWWPAFHNAANGFMPHAGWFVLLLGLTLLYQACRIDPLPHERRLPEVAA